MRRSELEYHLPERLIAQHPAKVRSDSRLLVVNRRQRKITHTVFRELPNFLKPHDILVLNNTRVRPARLFSIRAATGGQVEIFLLEERGHGRWRAMTGSGGRLLPGETLLLYRGGQAEPVLRAVLEQRHADGTWEVTFSVDGANRDVAELVQELARMPLPPYIRRSRKVDESEAEDRERYQTVYAKVDGAVAAPTAGLHFTEDLFEDLMRRGVQRTMLTLHVGPGTFRPIEAEQVEDHAMHEESFELGVAAVNDIQRAKAVGGRVVAVGSTSTRVLESCVDETGELKPQRGATDLMILPGFEWKVVDAMITNFHLPHSTLLALVMAFADTDLIRQAYREAVAAEYRFFSYGDAMLIL